MRLFPFSHVSRGVRGARVVILAGITMTAVPSPVFADAPSVFALNRDTPRSLVERRRARIEPRGLESAQLDMLLSRFGSEKSFVVLTGDRSPPVQLNDVLAMNVNDHPALRSRGPKSQNGSPSSGPRSGDGYGARAIRRHQALDQQRLRGENHLDVSEPHPLVAAFPRYHVVVCEAGCANGIAAIVSKTRKVIWEDAAYFGPTSSQMSALLSDSDVLVLPPQAPNTVICMAGCYGVQFAAYQAVSPDQQSSVEQLKSFASHASLGIRARLRRAFNSAALLRVLAMTRAAPVVAPMMADAAGGQSTPQASVSAEVASTVSQVTSKAPRSVSVSPPSPAAMVLTEARPSPRVAKRLTIRDLPRLSAALARRVALDTATSQRSAGTVSRAGLPSPPDMQTEKTLAMTEN